MGTEAVTGLPALDPEERRIQIRNLYLEGKGQREIARIIGISQPAVRKHLVKLGILRTTEDDESIPPETITFPLRMDEVLSIVARQGWQPQEKYLIRCIKCRGFVLTRRRGQMHCCNACGVHKPCSCGAKGRTRLVIN